MKSILRSIFILIISSSLVFLIAEGAIRGFNLFEEKRLAVDALRKDKPAAEDIPLHLVLHPYLGWSLRKGVGFEFDDPTMTQMFGEELGLWKNKYRHDSSPANDLGFHSDLGLEDLRTLGNEKTVIGIFGGSVAATLAVLTNGIKEMKAVLAGSLSVPVDSLEVLNFASHGYKQPQQVYTLSLALLLGIRFDIIINIDGFNELMEASRNIDMGHHPLWPDMGQYQSMVSLLKGELPLPLMEMAVEVKKIQERINKMGEWFSLHPRLENFEFVKAVAGSLLFKWTHEKNLIEGRLQGELAKGAAAADITSSLSEPCMKSKDGCWELLADVWAGSSLMMADMARQSGARYFHILQPNQYVPGGKPLSKEELSYYISKGEGTAAVIRGYPLLRDRGNMLAKKGVAFHDLSGVFQEHEETLYIDSCCHFNFQGNKILLNAIALILKDRIEK